MSVIAALWDQLIVVIAHMWAKRWFRICFYLLIFVWLAQWLQRFDLGATLDWLNSVLPKERPLIRGLFPSLYR
jgi:hypothetical protein